ncbi:hypothetical protein BGX31_011106 [Mortierella sp. GBA43]|nr:hypothetical protein BGX31_011106 [Mortierella sp. GBA43]
MDQQEPSVKQSTIDVPELTRIEKLRLKLRPLLLYVVSTAQFIDIATQLDFQVSQVLWIMNAYTIAFAGLLLFSGRLGDLFGHRRMFLFGLFSFSTWALVVSFSVSPIMFVICRALQGAGAAFTLPTAMAIVATSYPPGPERAKAFAIFGAFGGMGAVAGILLAGGLVSSIGWTWIFRVSSIVSYILWILGYLAIPPPPAATNKDNAPKVDYIGAVTATMGLTGIVYYISTGVEYGWADAKSLPVFFAGLLLIAGFLWTETKVDAPLMPLRVWKSRGFSSAVVLAFVSMAMAQGMMYYINMVFQEVYKWTSIQTALGFLVHAILAIVSFALLGRFLPRCQPKLLILIGFTLRCGTGIMFSFVDEHVSYWRLPFPALILHITGVAMTLLPVQMIAVRDADNKDQGLVSALYQTGLQLGAPFGIAILNAVSISTNGNQVHGGGPSLMKGYRNAFYGTIAMGVFGVVLAFFTLPWGRLMTGAEVTKGKDIESLDEKHGDESGVETVMSVSSEDSNTAQIGEENLDSKANSDGGSTTINK